MFITAQNLSFSLVFFMESLFSSCVSSSPPLLNPSKTLKSTPKSHAPLSNTTPISLQKFISFSHLQTHKSIDTSKTHSQITLLSLKPQISLLLLPLGFPFPPPCFAAEASAQEISSKINLESILISIDNFFTRYPFFVATVMFIYLIAIPLTEEYLQKYKFTSAINAFKRLRDDPVSQLLDIRDSRSVAVLGSPSLKFLSKSAAQVEFREEDEEGFVKKVLENFGDPNNTIVCIIDNFDGNSLKVAELLVKNGFKEAYAIRGGIRGKNGWQDIQETLLPPYVHVYPKKRIRKQKPVDTNGGIIQQDGNNVALSINSADDNSKEINGEDFSSRSLSAQSKVGHRPLSPYPNYPDFRPPSSPTPSKPE